MGSTSSDIESPCVRNCCLDKHDICIGCGRSVEEIIRWGDAGMVERVDILAKAKERKEKRLHENGL